ncbi:hypothetical protein GCK32_001251 [Trichostrongylus colubriformis]|uniref:Uncharacterized protein n=1 Tax=Trichostrongylus colubriformis TaxID=6319 RepID=A0AAN8IL84_TRICO
MAVLSKSNRSLSPNVSRRSSSALQMLPDMENLSDAEKQHIQNVLEKAESRIPYMIKKPLSHQLTARTESIQSSEAVSITVSRNSLDDGYDNQIRSIDDAIRKVEQRAESEQNSESPPQSSLKPSKTEEVDEALNIVATASREIAAIKAASSEGIPEVPPASSPSSVSPLGGFGSLLRKASSALFHATDIWGKEPVSGTEAEVVTPAETLSLEEIEHIQRVSKLAERDIDHPTTYGTRVPKADAKQSGKSEWESELTAEELEHIRKVSESAEKDLSDFMVGKAGPSRSARPSEAKEQGGTELTQEELDHINRVAQLAMLEESTQESGQYGRGGPPKRGDTGSVTPHPGSLVSVDGQQEHRSHSSASPSSSSMFAKGFSGFGLNTMKSVLYGTEEGRSPVRETAESESRAPEIPHVDRSERTIQSVTTSPKELVESRRAEPGCAEETTEKVVDLLPSSPAPTLTQEELDHINRVTKMAMEQERKQYEEHPRTPPSTSSSLFGTKSITGIGSKAFKGVMEKAVGVLTASEDSTMRQEVRSPPLAPQAKPAELTQEELDHIRRITEMAETEEMRQNATPSRPISKQEPPELTQEELDHIARISEMAAREESRQGVRPPPLQPASVVPDKSEAVPAELQQPSAPSLPGPVKGSKMIFGSKSITGLGFKAFKGVKERAEGVLAGTQDSTVKHEPVLPAPASQAEPSELTLEEIDHMKRVTEMAEAGEIRQEYRPPHQVLEPEPPVLTQEELDHINRINEIAAREEQSVGVRVPPLDQLTPKEPEELLGLPTEPHPEASSDEPVKEQPPPSPRSSASMFGTKSITGFGFKAFKGVMEKAEGAFAAVGDSAVRHEAHPPVPASQIEPTGLTQEELDHINRISQMAMEEESKQGVYQQQPSIKTEESDKKLIELPRDPHRLVEESRGEQTTAPPRLQAPKIDTKSFTGFGMKAFKGVIQKAEKARTRFEDLSMKQETRSPVSVVDETRADHTQEELDHINRINQMALQDEVRSQSRPPPVPGPSVELTQEEMDHIGRITQLAMEEEIVRDGGESPYDEQSDMSKEASDEQSTEPQTPTSPPAGFAGKPQTASSLFDSSTFSAKSLTGFGRKAFKGVVQKAEEARTALEDLTMRPEVHPSPIPPPEMSSGLTQEELDHINRINQMAMEDEGKREIGPQPLVLSVGELTQEELDHIGRIAQMADEDENRRGGAGAPQPLLQESQLTQEELDHINRIAQMAMQDGEFGGTESRKDSIHPKAYAPAPLKSMEEVPPISHRSTGSLFDTKTVGGFGLKAFKGVMQKAEEAKAALESRTAFTEAIKQKDNDAQQKIKGETRTHSEQPAGPVIEDEDRISIGQEATEYEAELDIPPGEIKPDTEDIVSQTKESRTTGVVGKAETSPVQSVEEASSRRSSSGSSLFNRKSFTGFGIRAFKDVMHKAEETKAAFEEMTKRKTSIESARSTNETVPTEAEAEPTEGELDAISRATTAINEKTKSEASPAPIPGAAELTQEELDHINRITQMALEQEVKLYEPHPQAPSVAPSSKFSTKSLTGFGFKAFKGVMEKAEGARTALEDLGLKQEVRRPSPVSRVAPPELSQEELDHISRINEMAGAGAIGQETHPSAPAPKQPLLELTQEELDHINRINQMAMEEEGVHSREHMPSPAPEGLVELTQEELDHIDRIAQIATEEQGGWTVPSPAEYFYPRSADEEKDRRDGDFVRPEGLSSPVSSTGSRRDLQSDLSRRSSGFDIRSIPDMVTKPNLSQWYEEQLSFMKESIADEEEEFRPSEEDHEPSPVLQERFAGEVVPEKEAVQGGALAPVASEGVWASTADEQNREIVPQDEFVEEGKRSEIELHGIPTPEQAPSSSAVTVAAKPHGDPASGNLSNIAGYHSV